MQTFMKHLFPGPDYGPASFNHVNYYIVVIFYRVCNNSKKSRLIGAAPGQQTALKNIKVRVI